MCQNVITIFGCCKYPDSTHISTESLPYMRRTGTPRDTLCFPSFLSSCFPSAVWGKHSVILNFEAYIMVIQSTFSCCVWEGCICKPYEVWFFTGSQKFQGRVLRIHLIHTLLQGVGSWEILWLKLRASGKVAPRLGQELGSLVSRHFQSLNF